MHGGELNPHSQLPVLIGNRMVPSTEMSISSLLYANTGPPACCLFQRIITHMLSLSEICSATVFSDSELCLQLKGTSYSFQNKNTKYKIETQKSPLPKFSPRTAKHMVFLLNINSNDLLKVLFHIETVPTKL